MNITVSIIIPVYNTERYIRKCLDSILAQTFTNWEAILINDGSIDNSGTICDEYAAKDTRFKVIHQKNEGVSSARQRGLENATGEYVIHCDPDDWIEHNMLIELIRCAKENNADMVICDFIEDRKNTSEYISQGLNNPISAKEVQTKIIKEQLHGSCWNKLVKRSCLKGITFSPNNIYINEDALFNIRTLNQDIQVHYLPKAFYHYNINNDNSICHSNSSKIILSKMQVIAECEKIIGKERYNGLFDMKKAVLISLFTARLYKELNNTYPETHRAIIDYSKRYRFSLPLGYFLAMALKGYPNLAYNCYNINIWLINVAKQIKKIIRPSLL